MLATAALNALLLVSATAADGERTLWLVQPLYPGQEVLVGRTEQAIDKLIPKEGRSKEIIGRGELSASLAGKDADLSCLFGEKVCADPIDAFVVGLGFDRVVLVRGGQDETGYNFKVVSYRPATGEVSPAEAANPGLERALLGALVKVVPLASSLEVRSTPPGATVFVDEVKVGVTPLSTQVLPGERAIKLDLKSHQPIEENLLVPVRGTAVFEKNLEKIAARVTITASPPGTEISLDGQVAGRDKIDRGINPGAHTVRLSREGHKAVELMFEVKPDESYTLDKTLEALEVVKPPDPAVKSPDVANPKPPDPFAAAPPPAPAPPAPPPPPLTAAERIYERRSYFQISFEPSALKGTRVDGTRFEGNSRADTITSGGLAMTGASAEYGTFGRHFGLAVIGLSYGEGVSQPWRVSISNPYTKPINNIDVTKDYIDASVRLVTVRALQPQFRWVLWRFQLSVQAGLEARAGNIVEVAKPEFYPNGFWPLDLLFSARLTVKAFVVEGLFVYGSYGTSFALLSTNAGMQGGTGGVGYAF